MADSINNKAKEYYDNDDTGGSLNNNLKDFLKQQGAEGNSLNTLWRNYAYGEGGNSLNTRLGKLWGTSGSLISRWKDVLGLTWDELKLFFNARRNDPELLLSGATSFDGDDDYISFPFQESGNYTISAWFKLDVAQTSIVVNWGDQATGERRSLLIWNGGSGGYHVYSSTYGSNIAGSTVLSTGVWYHASVTVDVSDGSAKVYLNGSLDGSGTNTINSFTGTTGEIGRQPSGEYFEGSIANVGIWNRALSASEIESIYWKGQYADLKGTELTNLVSWYNLSADANDSTGTNNGTNNGATFLTDAYSASSPFLPRIQDKASDTVANYGEVYGGNAVSFDGTNDYISVADSSSLDVSTNDFSVSAWFKKDTTKNQRIVDKRDTTGYTFYIDANDLARLELNDGSGYAIYTLSSAISSGVWHHILLSVDRSGNAICYLNGTLVGTVDISAKSNSLNSSSVLIIGADAPSANNLFFDGMMSGVKIFSEALTQDQVRELYTKPELTLPTGIASSALKLDMPMQEGSGVAILDGSGNQNHGTGSGITWANGQEYGFQHPLVRSNNPMRFETSDYVTVSKNSGTQISTGTYSVSVWIKPEGGTDSGTNYEIIDAESFNNNGWLIRLTGSDLKPYVRHNQASSATALSSTTAVTNGVWSHLVFVFASGTGAWYINGSLINSGSITAPVLGTTDMQIGGRSAQYFDGFINELSIWDSALTANEVTALYNSGLPLLPTADSGNYASADDLVGYWRNDGVTTWTDRSTNSNNGTVSGSPASIIVPEGLNEGRDSQGYYLTDTDSISSGIRLKGAEYISVQDSESLSFGNGTSDSPFSLEAWIKFSDVTNSTIISKGVYNTDAEYNFNIHSGNDLTLLLFDESVADTIQGQRTNTTLVANENQWTHVVSTYDGRGGTSANAGIKLYVNGAVVSSSAVTTGTYVAMENLGADVYIGKQTTNYAKGSIDEAKVYAKELSATEVLKNYNNGKSAHSN